MHLTATHACTVEFDCNALLFNVQYQQTNNLLVSQPYSTQRNSTHLASEEAAAAA